MVLPAILGIAAVIIIPGRIAYYAKREASPWAQQFYWPWAKQPELVQLFTSHVALSIGAPFRGAVNFFWGNEDGTIDDLWSRGIPTTNEYSQLASPPSLYFVHKLLKRDVRGLLNRFEFYWRNGSYTTNYWALSQLLGIRYGVDRPASVGGRSSLEGPGNPGLPVHTMRYHVPKQPEPEPSGPWYVYELPHPNLGDYSPTEVIVGRSGEEITAELSAPGFDYTKQVVLTSGIETPLFPARDMRLSMMRNGLHLSGESEGTSLVVLPQQFSHCLRVADPKVRLVRANLLLTGVIFLRRIDTNISFDYGIFFPRCRLADLTDIELLDLRIDLRMPHIKDGPLFPDWRDALARLKGAILALPALRP